MIELSFAVRFQVLPDVVDLSHVLTLSGFGGFVTALIGAGLRFEADRLARLVLLGNLVGGVAGSLLVLRVAVEVIS
jgi:hypothetical protein